MRWAWILFVVGCSSRADVVPSSCAARDGTIVALPGGVTNAVFVGDMLFFDSNDTQRISRVPLAGGAIETLVDSGATGEWASGAGVFAWETEPVHATPSSPDYVDQLHIRDQSGAVYDLPPSMNGSAVLLSVDASGNVYWIPPDANGVERWDHETHQQTLLAHAGLRLVDDTHLYWVSADQVLSMPAGGGEAQTLVTFAGTTLSLVADDADNLYVTTTPPLTTPSLGGFEPSQIQSVPKRGGAPLLIADNVDPWLSEVVAGDGHLYWVAVPPGTGDYIPELDVVRAPKTGGAVEQIAVVKGDVSALGIDACNLYTVSGDGLVAHPLAP